MNTRFFDKYCPNCRKSISFYLSPADDKFACTNCTERYTNEALDAAFLTIHRETPLINPIKVENMAKMMSVPLSDIAPSKLNTNAALKFDGSKPQMELLDPIAMQKIAEVMTFGAKKYAAHNWRKGFQWSRLLGAAFRHLSAYIGGEDKDPESGLSHLAHCGCCIMFLLWHEEKRKDLDDRYKDVV